MTPVRLADAPVYRTSVMLTESTPLHVHLVKGEQFSVWIDSGVRSMFPDLLATMAAAKVDRERLRFVLHTHSHHDHIGCNGQLRRATGCLIAADPTYATWHANFETHYQEFARPFPSLVPDTDELRHEVLSILDEPVPLDIELTEGVVFDLGGGTRLHAISLPGHMLAEYGWWESGSGYLLLGDAVTGLDWPIFHSHLDVAAYRATLDKLERILEEKQIRRVALAHFPDMDPATFMELLAKARRYIDAVEATILGVLGSTATATLEVLWRETCRRHTRAQDFRALNMVHAHLVDLQARGLVASKGEHHYALR